MTRPLIQPYDPAQDAWQDGRAVLPPAAPVVPDVAPPPETAASGGERSAAGSNYGDWRPARQDEAPTADAAPEAQPADRQRLPGPSPSDSKRG